MRDLRSRRSGSPGRRGHREYHAGIAEAGLVPLDAHHITDRNELPNGGCVAENGISLCETGCHLLAEVFHRTGTAHPGFSPADLYERIGSSRDAAERASSESA